MQCLHTFFFQIQMSYGKSITKRPKVVSYSEIHEMMEEINNRRNIHLEYADMFSQWAQEHADTSVVILSNNN